MAKNIDVNLNGKQTVSDAANAASQGLGGLANAANTAIEAAKGFIAYEILQKVADYATQCVEAFAEQEKATISLNAAMLASQNITSQASTDLLSYADSMSKVSGESVETIQSMETFLITSGRNETQIKAIIQAALDMSVATGDSLDGAVKKLNGTFDGTAGRLSKMIPDIKELTKEQLEHGDAIAIVEQHYRGLSDALQSSTDVSIKNNKNAWKELFAAIGDSISTTLTLHRDAVTEVVSSWVSAIKQVKEYSDAIKHINDKNPLIQAQSDLTIATTTQSKLKKDLPNILNGLNLGNYQQYQVMAGGDANEAQYNSERQAVLDNYDKQDRALQKTIDGLQVFVDSLSKASDASKGKSDSNTGTIDTNKPYYNPANLVEIMNATWDDVAKSRQHSGSATTGQHDNEPNFTDTVVSQSLDGLFEEAKSSDAFTREYQTNDIENTETIQDILNQLHTDNLNGNNGIIAMLGELKSNIGNMLTSSLGQNGGAAGGFIQNAITNIQQLGLVAGLIVTILKPIIDSFVTKIGPELNQCLAPILGLFAYLGQIVGQTIIPILQKIQPLLESWAGVEGDTLPIIIELLDSLSCLNFVLPIVDVLLKGLGTAVLIISAPFKFIADLLTYVGTVISTFASNIASVIDNIFTPWDISWKSVGNFSSDAFTGLQTQIINLWNGTNPAIDAAGAAAIGNTTAASYQEARPVNITITVNTDVITDTQGGMDALINIMNTRAKQMNLLGVMS